MAEQATGFDEFVDSALPRLLGLAHGLTGNPHDAWDLTQETLVRIGLRWRRIDPGGNPYGYARTTLVRLNVDRLRRLRREGPRPVLPDRPGRERDDDGVEAWLLDALASLSPKQRAAVVLRYAEDLDIADVATTLNCSSTTARSHLSRGLERLRRLAPDDASEGSPP